MHGSHSGGQGRGHALGSEVSGTSACARARHSAAPAAAGRPLRRGRRRRHGGRRARLAHCHDRRGCCRRRSSWRGARAYSRRRRCRCCCQWLWLRRRRARRQRVLLSRHWLRLSAWRLCSLSRALFCALLRGGCGFRGRGRTCLRVPHCLVAAVRCCHCCSCAGVASCGRLCTFCGHRTRQRLRRLLAQKGQDVRLEGSCGAGAGGGASVGVVRWAERARGGLRGSEAAGKESRVLQDAGALL
jgi:hypothetical protein